jgi:hypothetical protein
MPSKRGRRDHAKEAKPPQSPVALLNADPRMPNGYTVFRELSIGREDEEQFAQTLFDFVNDFSNSMMMRSSDPETSYKLAKRFLTRETKLKFWPTFLVKTEHEFLHVLYGFRSFI